MKKWPENFSEIENGGHKNLLMLFNEIFFENFWFFKKRNQTEKFSRSKTFSKNFATLISLDRINNPII